MTDGEGISAVAEAIGELGADQVNELNKLAGLTVRQHREREGAVAALIAAIRERPELQDGIIYVVARYLVRVEEWKMRAKIEGKRMPKHDGASDVVARAATVLAYMDTFILPTGDCLGNADRETLSEAAQEYARTEEGTRRTRQFIEAIARKVPSGKRVRDVLTDQQILKLRSKFHG